MKILLVSPYFIDSYKNNISMGSAVKLAFNLSKIASVTVLTSGRKQEKETFNKNLTVLSVFGFLIPDPVNYMISMSLLVKFWKLAKELKPDVVIVSKYMFFSSFVIPLARMLNIPVVTVTDTFPGVNWFSVSKFASAVMWVYARLIGIPLLKISNKVVLLHSGLESLAKKYGLKHVTISNGVDSKYFEKLEIPGDIKKNKGEFWVGFVGRPESAKGYSHFLKIAQDLKGNKNIRFVIAGGGDDVRIDNNVIHLGFRKDIMNVYQLFDVLVLPSHAEGLPNVVMEAMSQKVSVVAYAVGGVLSLIKDRETGFLVEPENVLMMEDRVVELYGNKKLAEKIGNNAKKFIVKQYSWDKIIGQYKMLIDEVLE